MSTSMIRWNSNQRPVVSQRLNEVVMLGVTAIAEDSGDELTWDVEAGRFTNKGSANKFLKRTYRKGWEI